MVLSIGDETVAVSPEGHGWDPAGKFVAVPFFPPEDTAIPFALATYGWSGHLRPLQPPVTQMDVHPTVLHWLGIEPAPGLDGRVQGLPQATRSGARSEP